MPFARKLTAAKVQHVRTTPKYYGRVRDLARELGVSLETIRRVLRGFTYKRVPHVAQSLRH